MIAYSGSRPYKTREDVVALLMDALSRTCLVAADVETFSTEDLTLVGVGLATSRDEAFYITMWPDDDALWPVFKNILERPDYTKVLHNALFDMAALIGRAEVSNVEDTMLMARLLNVPASLEECAAAIGIEAHSMGEYIRQHKAKSVAELPPGLVAAKCCQDCQATYGLYEHLSSQVDQEYYQTEVATIPILDSMTRRGIKIDQEVREQLQIKLETDVMYYGDICAAEGFNPGSPEQVGYILAKRGNHLPIRRKYNQKDDEWRRKIQTAEEELEKLTDPLASIILNYRRYSKALSTYVKPLAGMKRSFSRWHLDAVTGRPSSTHRNMQNIPGLYNIKGLPNLRAMFIPDDGVFTDWDASQIELRCLTYLSGDEDMQYIYSTGGDIHQATADFMGIDRKVAKNVNFSMIYGATDKTIMETAHIDNIHRAHQLKDMWFQKFRTAGRWIEDQHKRGREEGYVTTLYGRNILLPIGLESDDKIDRKAVNYPVQASAAEIIKRAMLKCKELPLVLQVHDELIADGNVVKAVEELDLEHLSMLHTPYEIKTLERWE